jgi:hypothetical protein
MAIAYRLVSVISLCLVLVLGAATQAAAQSGRCLIEGFVIGGGELDSLAGATVELIGDPNTASVRAVKLSATTDAEGKYSLSEIPHGPYTLRASAPGYRTYEIPIYMLSDTKTQLHIRLEKAKDSPRS